MRNCHKLTSTKVSTAFSQLPLFRLASLACARRPAGACGCATLLCNCVRDALLSCAASGGWVGAGRSNHCDEPALSTTVRCCMWLQCPSPGPPEGARCAANAWNAFFGEAAELSGPSEVIFSSNHALCFSLSQFSPLFLLSAFLQFVNPHTRLRLL